MGPTRFLISEAIVKNACSTLVDVLADVSRKGIPGVTGMIFGLIEKRLMIRMFVLIMIDILVRHWSVS